MHATKLLASFGCKYICLLVKAPMSCLVYVFDVLLYAVFQPCFYLRLVIWGMDVCSCVCFTYVMCSLCIWMSFVFISGQLFGVWMDALVHVCVCGSIQGSMLIKQLLEGNLLCRQQNVHNMPLFVAALTSGLLSSIGFCAVVHHPFLMNASGYSQGRQRQWFPWLA